MRGSSSTDEGGRSRLRARCRRGRTGRWSWKCDGRPNVPGTSKIREDRAESCQKLEGMTTEQFINYIGAKAKKVLREARAKKPSGGQK